MKPVALTPGVLGAADVFWIWRAKDCPGWVSNGSLLVFVGEEAAAKFPEGRDVAAAFAKWTALERTPVVEDAAFRIPHTVAQPDIRPKCDACNGDGICTCACGDEHDCRQCDGNGKIGREPPPARRGQRVYRTDAGHQN